MKKLLEDGFKMLAGTRLKKIWRTYQDSPEKLMEAQDRLFGEIMSEHEEYKIVWNRADAPRMKEMTIDGTNPFFHIHIHAVIREQEKKGNPPAVKKAIQILIKKGFSRHEAEHKLAELLRKRIVYSLKNLEQFNETGYERDVAELLKRI